MNDAAGFAKYFQHECGGFTIIRESLNYTTAARIKAVWPSRFASIAAALPFVRNERKLANKVYGDRLGNRDPGDGYKYRGRGFLQLTGRSNYEAMEDSLDLPFVDEPDLASEPNEALMDRICRLRPITQSRKPVSSGWSS